MENLRIVLAADLQLTGDVARFIGSPQMNLFEGELAARHGCDLFGVRPEHIDLGRTEATWTGRVHHMERLGSDAILHLEADGVGPLTIRTDGETDVAIGETVFATPRPAASTASRQGREFEAQSS